MGNWDNWNICSIVQSGKYLNLPVRRKFSLLLQSASGTPQGSNILNTQNLYSDEATKFCNIYMDAWDCEKQPACISSMGLSWCSSSSMSIFSNSTFGYAVFRNGTLIYFKLLWASAERMLSLWVAWSLKPGACHSNVWFFLALLSRTISFLPFLALAIVTALMHW